MVPGALTSSGEIVWKTRFDYQSQPWCRRLADRLWRSVDLQCDGSDVAFVIALDKNTGKTEMENQSRLSRRSGLTPRRW
jgi:hypothetical protein